MGPRRVCGGKKVRPKVVASTATIKSADVQVRALFLRTVNVFPPHGLDVQDNFFSLQRMPSDENPGKGNERKRGHSKGKGDIQLFPIRESECPLVPETGLEPALG